MRSHLKKRSFLGILILAFHFATAQKDIPLPYELREETKPQLSGMTWHNNNLYLVPQYLSNRRHTLEGDLFIYSISADSIQRVVEGTDSALRSCLAIRIKNADKLPSEIQDHYEGFEAIAIHGKRVYFTIELSGTWKTNYIVCGKLNARKHSIRISRKSVIKLERFDQTDNAGFESLAIDPKTRKLTAVYEFNAAAQPNFAYEIDARLKTAKKIAVPFSYFRITDITTNNDTLYALNYHWGGDYNSYLKPYQPEHITDSVPELKDILSQNPSYLNEPSKTFAKILYLEPSNHTQWKTAMVVENKTSENNWEGLVRYKDGFLILSDSNESGPLRTHLRYVVPAKVP